MQQQPRASKRPKQRGGHKLHHAAPLPGQFAPVPPGTGEAPRHQADRVAHRRGNRRKAEVNQGGKRDQGPGADHGVDGPRGDAGQHDGHNLEGAHRVGSQEGDGTMAGSQTPGFASGAPGEKVAATHLVATLPISHSKLPPSYSTTVTLLESPRRRRANNRRGKPRERFSGGIALEAVLKT
jgi:hypothetical protein